MRFDPIPYVCGCDKREVLQSSYSGEFVSCSCQKCFIDQTPYYTRGGGGVIPKEEYENSLAYNNKTETTLVDDNSSK